MSETLVSVDNLSMRFGGVQALNDISFKVNKNSITALIGPNGAGKTTLFNCLTGFYKATEGRLSFYKEEGVVEINQILGEAFYLKDIMAPKSFFRKLFYKMFGGSHRVCRLGVARTFQNIRLFKDMTVIENCLVAEHLNLNRNLLAGILNTKNYQESEAAAIRKAYEWLDIVGLSSEANQLAGALPYGHQRRLEIARALCTNPKMICLDEPAAGLNPKESESLKTLILQIKEKFHVTVLLIEHDMKLVMNISDHVVVLDHGEVIAMGEPAIVREDPKVLSAYLGVEHEELP